MNKMSLYIIILLIFTLMGCATIPSSDIPTYSLPKKIITYNKKDVTFSINFMQEVFPINEEQITNQQDIANEIKKAFKKSKLFRRIYYVSQSHASNYHYHFNVMITGTLPKNQYLLTLPLMIPFVNLAYMCTPFWININIDISMHLIVKGKEVYAVTAPQKIKDIFWIGFILAWPIFNHGVIGKHIENNAINYFISEIIQNKLYEYEIE